MKKLFLLSAAALALMATPALADNHSDKGPKGGGKMFEKHDTNGDGVVSESEFLEEAKGRFSKMDTDGNGEVTQDEAKAAHEAMREKRKEMREKRKEMREQKKESSSDSE